MAEPVVAAETSPPRRQRPGHLLDVLGEIGAARMRDDDHLGDRDDGTGTAVVARGLARVVREGRVSHGVLHGAEPTWTLLAAATLAAATAQRGPALRAALLAHAATVTAWLQALDDRGPA